VDGDRDVVDLRSDTVTRPGPGMRAAIADAVVGDDALGDDPTVQRLERRTADLLGKEGAVFFPSGIMANQAALLVLGRPGTEAVCEATSHIVDWELGGAAANAGLQLRPVHTPDGILTAELVEPAIRDTAATLQIQTSLIVIENTHNAAGGRVMPLTRMREIRDLARMRGLPVHLDGARLWHAAAASNHNVAEYAACADTVMVTFSKGLGCPVGSMLAGEAASMLRARVVRRRLGGSMRQAGILAAAGIYALDHNVARLREDHVRASRLAHSAARVQGIRCARPETNIVMLDIERSGLTAQVLLARLAERGVLMTAFAPGRIRAVTHLDVDDGAVERAVTALSASLAH
jgi:threonine aldolase